MAREKEIVIPWGVLLPNPEDPRTRIAYMTTTDRDQNRPTKRIRITFTRTALEQLLQRAVDQGCCAVAVNNLRALLR
jgi:hypothetical protein